MVLHIGAYITMLSTNTSVGQNDEITYDTRAGMLGFRTDAENVPLTDPYKRSRFRKCSAGAQATYVPVSSHLIRKESAACQEIATDPSLHWW